MAPTAQAELSLIKIDLRGDLVLRVGKTENGDTNDTKCFLVCSNTLSRVSPVFARMLNGPFSESKDKPNSPSDLICITDTNTDNLSKTDPSSPDPWTINLPNDNPHSFTLFARISHGLLNQIPRLLTVTQLCDLTLLTNYYDATHLLVPWVAAWLGGPGGKGLDFSGTVDVLPKTLWISWELGRAQAFEDIAGRMVVECSGVVFGSGGVVQGLPLPGDVVEGIAAIRRQTIQAMLDIFREFTDLLVVVDEKPRWCQHATFLGPHRCESMILGSLTFCLTRAGLWPIPDTDDVDMSVVDLHQSLSNLVMHDIGIEGAKGTKGADHRGCNPRDFLMDRIRVILAEMPNPVNDKHRRRLDEQARKLYG